MEAGGWPLWSLGSLSRAQGRCHLIQAHESQDIPQGHPHAYGSGEGWLLYGCLLFCDPLTVEVLVWREQAVSESCLQKQKLKRSLVSRQTAWRYDVVVA